MPRFAFTSEGLVVESSFASNDADFSCCGCGQPLIFVRSSSRCQAYFRHKEQNDLCSDSTPTPVVEPNESTLVTHSMTPWHAEWQNIGESIHPQRREICGIGKDIQRPRDLGDKDENAMVEIQHSPMSSEEYEHRNAGVNSATWIFDATIQELWKLKHDIHSFESVLSEKNSKTVDIEQFKAYLLAKNKLNTQVRPFYEGALHRKMKWRQFVYGRKSEDRFLESAIFVPLCKATRATNEGRLAQTPPCGEACAEGMETKNTCQECARASRGASSRRGRSPWAVHGHHRCCIVRGRSPPKAKAHLRRGRTAPEPAYTEYVPSP